MNTNYQIGVDIDVRGGTRAAAELNKTDSALNKFGQTASGALSSFSGNLASDAFQKVTSLALEGGKVLLDYKSKLEQTAIGFETLLGSGEKAQVLLKEIQDFAKSTPFEFQGIAALSQRLLGANVEAEKIIPLMRDIGNVVAATGEASQERLEGVTVAITQMIGKQKVSAEEMEQLAERGINGFDLLAKATGKSQAEIRKLSEQGAISADVFLQALQKISQEKFGDAMDKQSRTFSGAMSNIKDSLYQTASTAFQPWYDELSKFAVNFADALENSNSEDLAEKFGYATGEAIGKGLRRWATDWDWTDVFKYVFPQYAISEYFAQIGQKMGEGIVNGFSEYSEAYGNLLKGVNLNGITYKYDPVTGIIQQIGKEVDKVKNKITALPSLAEKMEADKAKKQAESLTSIIDNLTSSIAFFGQTSEYAATQQRLIAAGVTDLTSARAREALGLASVLDRLNAAKKSADEYSQKLESASKYMRDLADNARFNASFPDATPLQQFDQWAKQNAEQFKELRFELEATRRALEHQAWMDAWNDFEKSSNMAFESLVTNVINAERKVTAADNAMTDFFSRFNLEGFKGDTPFQSITKTVEIIQNMMDNITRIEKLQADYKAQNQGVDLSADSVWSKMSADLADAQRQLNQFLDTLAVRLPNGQIAPLFAFRKDGASNRFLEWLQRLNEIVKKQELQTGLERLDSVMESLNLRFEANGQVFGAQTPLDRLTKMLADPAMTAAIEARAAAMAMTVEQYKEYLLAAQRAELAFAEPAAQNASGERGERNGFSRGVFDGIFGADGVSVIQSEAEYIKDVYRDLGATTGDIIGQMISGAGRLLETWILTGEASGAAVAQMAASVIAGLVVQSGIKAIFETAEGFAAAARYDFVSAAGHFTAAKIYGGIALGALGVGLGIGAAGGLQGKKNSNNSSATRNDSPEDYVPIQSDRVAQANQISELNRQISVLSQTIGSMDNKLKGMREGEVLVRGINQNRGLISDTTIRELKGNSTKKNELGRTLGMK